jgi:hypothetical protein
MEEKGLLTQAPLGLILERKVSLVSVISDIHGSTVL